MNEGLMETKDSSREAEVQLEQAPTVIETKTDDGMNRSVRDAEELEDILRGVAFAALAITDDKTDTLKNVGRTGPWHIQAMKLITGSNTEAYRKLTEILKDHMELDIDCHIDISGITKGGHFLDTQGYIAHNDQFIVLSYRCTTSVYDWLTNFNTTSSAWEIEKDYKLGFSGYCSSLEGLCCGPKERPRVHTGFYNNFLASLTLIKQHIEPMLGPSQPPRKLFVTGHSLGAGIATLAACYFLLEYDWSIMPQTLISVTAGSPRACGRLMCDVVKQRIDEFASAKRVRMYRVVRGSDVVARLPPSSIVGLYHIVDPILIEEDGKIHLKRVNQPQESEVNQETMKELVKKLPRQSEIEQRMKNDDRNEEGGRDHSATRTSIEDDDSRYRNLVAKVPSSLRDHMPDHYIQPFLQATGVPNASVRALKE